MFEYKGLVYRSENMIYFKSNVQLKEQYVVSIEGKSYFIDSFEEGYLILKPVRSFVSCYK